MATPEPSALKAAPVARAFGAENRARLLDRYFADHTDVREDNAWQHVYRLLLWIDRTTALAHCYESDKAQPGRVWYARSLAFHRWVADSLATAPYELGEHIDWLFRAAVRELASRSFESRSEAYMAQRAAYANEAFPEPGDDAELEAIITDALGPWLAATPSDEAMRALTRQIYAYVTQENKRKNLVGEGFEDTLAAVIRKLPWGSAVQVHSRAVLHDIRGFHRTAANEKPRKVDLAIVSPTRRTLVSAKWSIRADREEQFASDFEAYARLEAAGEDFDYVLITNEFDAARLRAACERRRQNAPLFTRVVHINPAAVQAAYLGAAGGSIGSVLDHVEHGRLLSLQLWLEGLGRQGITRQEARSTLRGATCD